MRRQDAFPWRIPSPTMAEWTVHPRFPSTATRPCARPRATGSHRVLTAIGVGKRDLDASGQHRLRCAPPARALHRRSEGMAILLRIGETDELSVRQAGFPRALDLHRIQSGRVVHPDDHLRSGEYALLDFGAGVVRNDALAIDPHPQLLVPDIRPRIGDIEHVGSVTGGARSEFGAQRADRSTFDARKHSSAAERARNV